jgi:hypothetical protein
MPKVVTFVSNHILDTIKKTAGDSGKALSKAFSELIELGFKVQQINDNKNQNTSENPHDRHTEFLLRILSVVSDIYRCNRNDNSLYKEKNMDEALDIMKFNALNYINNPEEY